MASLATIVNRFAGEQDVPTAGSGSAVGQREECRLRALPNEDVYLFVKRIDNRAVVRAADPGARRARARSMVMGLLAALMLVAGLAPAAYSRIEGRHISELRQRQAELQIQQKQLELQEADLVRVERLRTIAKEFGFVDPSPESLEYLDGKNKAEARARVPETTGPAASR
jgi:hypothetical protein